MKLSTRARYGTRAVVALAAGYPNQAISVRALAEDLRLSPKYLEHIMAALKTADLVKATRGMRGGYTLARPPADITLEELFRVLEGTTVPVDCVADTRACAQARSCPVRDTWVELNAAVSSVLSNTTLAQLVARHRRKAAEQSPTYTI